MEKENAYNREKIKAEMQELEQKIARIDAGEILPGVDINQLHEQYEQLQSELSESDLAQAA